MAIRGFPGQRPGTCGIEGAGAGDGARRVWRREGAGGGGVVRQLQAQDAHLGRPAAGDDEGLARFKLADVVGWDAS